MILRYRHLHCFPTVFRSVTGLRVDEFDCLVRDLLPAFGAAREKRLHRAERQRAMGAGDKAALDARDQILLAVIWLRIYPTNEVLGFFFGVSDSTVSRILSRLVPLLAQAGKDTMRMPDPGRKHRRELDSLLADLPELAVVIDSFEQRVQRPKPKVQSKQPQQEQNQPPQSQPPQPQLPPQETKTQPGAKAKSKTKAKPEQPPDENNWYSGKKKQHTIKSQVAVNLHTGEVVDVADSVRGPVNDQTLLEQSSLLGRLPDGVGGMGDLGYYGMPESAGKLHTPRRKPRGKERPPQDAAYNKAFAKARVIVENTILRLRRYESLRQTDRHHRQGHTDRVCAAAGLVNRQIYHRQPRLAA